MLVFKEEFEILEIVWCLFNDVYEGLVVEDFKEVWIKIMVDFEDFVGKIEIIFYFIWEIIENV